MQCLKWESSLNIMHAANILYLFDDRDKFLHQNLSLGLSKYSFYLFFFPLLIKIALWICLWLVSKELANFPPFYISYRIYGKTSTLLLHSLLFLIFVFLKSQMWQRKTCLLVSAALTPGCCYLEEMFSLTLGLSILIYKIRQLQTPSNFLWICV